MDSKNINRGQGTITSSNGSEEKPEANEDNIESKISKTPNFEGFSLPEDFSIENVVIPQSTNDTELGTISSRNVIYIIAALIFAYKNRDNDNSVWKYKPYLKKTVFRYRPFDDNTIDTLENYYIYHSSVSHFNDPYDCLAKQAFSIYKENTNERFDEELEEFEDFLKHTAVACFSKTQNSLLMWSHYARNHSGICIEYYTNELNRENSYTKDEILEETHKKYVSKNPQFFKGLFEIKYATNMITEKDESTYADLVSLPDIFLRKYSNWRYEKEIRRTIYIPNPSIRKSRKFYHTLEAIKAIYIGATANSNTVKTILEIVKHCYNNKVKVYKAELLPNSYELRFEPVNNL